MLCGRNTTQTQSPASPQPQRAMETVNTVIHLPSWTHNVAFVPAEYTSSISELVESEEEREGEATTDALTTTIEESRHYRTETEGRGAGLPSLMLTKQELLRQCQLKQHMDKLDDEVQRKEETVKRIRLVWS